MAKDDKLTHVTDAWPRPMTASLRSTDQPQANAPASFIIHWLNVVNQQVRPGRYFYTDIVRDGIAPTRRRVTISLTQRPRRHPRR